MAVNDAWYLPAKYELGNIYRANCGYPFSSSNINISTWSSTATSWENNAYALYPNGNWDEVGSRMGQKCQICPARKIQTYKGASSTTPTTPTNPELNAEYTLNIIDSSSNRNLCDPLVMKKENMVGVDYYTFTIPESYTIYELNDVCLSFYIKNKDGSIWSRTLEEDISIFSNTLNEYHLKKDNKLRYPISIINWTGGKITVIFNPLGGDIILESQKQFAHYNPKPGNHPYIVINEDGHEVLPNGNNIDTYSTQITITRGDIIRFYQYNGGAHNRDLFFVTKEDLNIDDYNPFLKIKAANNVSDHFNVIGSNSKSQKYRVTINANVGYVFFTKIE